MVQGSDWLAGPGSAGGDDATGGGLGGAGQGLVALEPVNRVLPLPARAAEVLEALKVAAEVRPHHTVAHGAQGVLQVWVDLHLRAWRQCSHTRLQTS